MALTNAAMVVAANALRAAMTKAKIHTGDPGALGTANNTTAAAVSVTWSTATNDGDFGLASALNFSGGAANGPVAWVSLWDTAITAFYGRYPVSGDATFNSVGEYVLNVLDINGSAS